MPHLQKFTVWNYGAEPLNGTRTLDLLSRFARLEEVTLTYPDWTQLDAEALQKIACGCPRIRSFQYLVNAEDNQ